MSQSKSRLQEFLEEEGGILRHREQKKLRMRERQNEKEWKKQTPEKVLKNAVK